MDARSTPNVNEEVTLAALSARVIKLEAELKRREESCQSHLESLQKEQDEFTRICDENSQLKLEISVYAEKEDAYLAQLMLAQEEIQKLKSDLQKKQILQQLLPIHKMFSLRQASGRDEKSTPSTEHSCTP